VLVINGYRWTLLDIVFALPSAIFFGYVAFGVALKDGLTLATAAGALCWYGTIMFVLLSWFPLFGEPAERVGLSQKHTALPIETPKTVKLMGSNFMAVNSKTLKWFFLFFTTTGGLAIVGLLTNT
jgi:hypothetical protein